MSQPNGNDFMIKEGMDEPPGGKAKFPADAGAGAGAGAGAATGGLTLH